MGERERVRCEKNDSRRHASRRGIRGEEGDADTSRTRSGGRASRTNGGSSGIVAPNRFGVSGSVRVQRLRLAGESRRERGHHLRRRARELLLELELLVLVLLLLLSLLQVVLQRQERLVRINRDRQRCDLVQGGR